MHKEILDNLEYVHPKWMFMSVVGSQNYGTATVDSDVDVKIAYLPTFEEFYRNSFAHVDKSGPDMRVDYTLHPVHEFLNHAFKGNINFWEVFFSPSFRVNIELWDSSGELNAFYDAIRRYVNGNFLANFNTMRGMAVQKHKEAIKLYSVVDDRKAWKSAQHSMRLLDTIRKYYETGRVSLNICDGTHNWEYWRHTIMRSGDFDHYLSMFETDLHGIDMFEPEIKYWDMDLKSHGLVRKNFIDRTLMNMVLRNS